MVHAPSSQTLPPPPPPPQAPYMDPAIVSVSGMNHIFVVAGFNFNASAF